MSTYELVRSWELWTIEELVKSLRAAGYRQIVGRRPETGEYRLYRARGAKTRGMFCCVWIPCAEPPDSVDAG